MKLIAGIGMILVGVLFPTFWISKIKTPLRPFLIGGLLWVICVGMKFAVAIPFNQRLLQTLLIHLHPLRAQIIYYTYLGLLTGIFECGLLYVIIRQTSLRFYDLNSAVAFGIGFGSIEAIAVGVKFSISAIITGNMTFPSNFILLLYIPAPIVERFFTVFGQLFCSLLIFYAIRNRQASYFFISFLFKTLVDGSAGWFVYNVAPSLSNVWLAELVIAFFGTLSFFGYKYLRKKYNTAPDLQVAAIPN